MFIAWHLKSGPDMDTYFQYTLRRRALIMRAVVRRIENHNAAFDDLE